MNILIGGSSGLVGRALVAHLESRGHEVTRLVRGHSENARTLTWDPTNGELNLPTETPFDAVVHLGGANIAEGRWTRKRKRELRDSRLQGTDLLARVISRLPAPPKVFACASAVGIYGHRGDEELDEDARPADDFLGRLAQDWEAACNPAVAAGIRVLNLRLGVVLSSEGGALAKMLTPFRLGLGGRLGTGRQYMSWISLPDTVRAIEFCLSSESLAGPINLVSPRPVTNSEFTLALAEALDRPAVFPAPAFLLRLLLGEMADAALLASTRAIPTRLIEHGFTFAHPDVAGLKGFLSRQTR